MMRKVLLLIGILVLGLEASVFAAALDAPHNQTNAMVCNDCHVFGTYPLNDACLSCHINDTGAGYSKSNAPKMLTHSSENTSTKYGTWSKLCKDCHQPHAQNQREIYGSEAYLVTGTITSATRNITLNTVTYGYSSITAHKPEWADFTKWDNKSSNAADGNERGLILFPNVANFARSAEIISATSTQITVRGYPGTVAAGSSFAIVYGQFLSTDVGGKTVKFFNNTGQNSFAYDESGTGTDPTPDGLCQVCHTQTDVWRTDGTRAATGSHVSRNGVNCIGCHKHEEGFKADCGGCHGQPPVDAGTLVHSPATPTGSTTAGAHDKHVNTVGIACTNCHNSSVGSGPTHNDGTVQAITLGFYLFGGAVQGGTYDGQSGVDYNTTVTSPVTNVSNAGSKQCSNIYCHSTGQSSSGGALAGGDYKTPVWSGTVICGDCHKADGAQGTMTYMDSGSHLRHIDADIKLTCSECHNGAGSGTSKHANNLIEIAFNTNPFGHSSSYSQSPNTPGNGYGTCSTVYCHSIGQGYGGAALVPGTSDYKTPTWGGTTLCGNCHNNSDMASGSHTPHLDVSGVNCLTCHNNAGPGTIKHANKNIDTEFGGLAGTGTYSQNPNPPGNGYGSCSTTNCHGTASPLWGTDFTGVTTCEKCHGSAATAALGSFKDTSGSAASGKAVTHVVHLAATHNLTSPIACTSCHTVPATVTAAGHIDTALPAEVDPSRGFSGGTCSTTYCHGSAMPKGTTEGANKTPTWSDTTYLTGVSSHDCAQCHGYPPAALWVHNEVGPTNCISCHDHVNSSGAGFTDVSKHVNGLLDVGDNCLVCHSSLSATHLKHTDAATLLSGKKVSSGDFGQPWFYSVSYTSGSPKFGCGFCHPNTPSTHMNGTKNLNLDPSDPAAAGTVKTKNGTPSYTQNTGVSVTCSSVYCHSNGYDDGTGYVYQTTPNWYAGTFANADKCANCHGNSPNSGGKVGSLSHYNSNSMGVGVVGGHFVGIHYKNVFTGTTGVTKDAGLRQNAHGTASTMSTINCQTCHNATVTTSANDLNTICSTCHTSPDKGTMSIDTSSITHINGTPDIVFAFGTINSKAQIRDNITGVTELDNSWTRNNGYKVDSTSFDGSKTVASYNPGTKSCSSVACHNGNSVTWAATNITCNSCHTSLP